MTFTKDDRVVMKGDQLLAGTVLDVWTNQDGDMHPVVVRWDNKFTNRNPATGMYIGPHDIVLDIQIEKIR